MVHKSEEIKDAEVPRKRFTIPNKERNNKGKHLTKDGPRQEQALSLTKVKKALPKHCFQSDLKTSFYYLFKDYFCLLVLYISIRLIEDQPYQILRWIYTPIYCFLQGTVFFALFAIGHDCGHGSFSRFTIVNDIVGTFVHTLVLLPYYPWKMSHKHHHKNTGNFDEDEGFFPIRKKDDNGIKSAKYFLFGFGWFFFLAKGFYPRGKNHFNFTDSFFSAHYFKCLISVVLVGLWLTLLFIYAYLYGLKAFIIHYNIPVLVYASWMTIVTFLQHTDQTLPWYSNKAWDYVRGQLCTIDRHYGWAHNIIHGVGTHQIHHLFSKVPHYHLEEATAIYRKVFPDYVNTSDEPIMKSFCRLYEVYEEQRRIENDTEVHWYK